MSTPGKQHNLEIDASKGLFVVTMVLAHVIVLLSDQATRIFTAELKMAATLASFSGFLFCFGFATWHAYFSQAPSLKRVLPSAIRPWIAYYISSIFYLLFVERLYGIKDFADVLLLTRLVPFAEFLLAFSLTLLAGFLFHKPIGFLLERPRLFFAVVGALALTALIPNGWVRWPMLGMFIGAPERVASTFPIVQYFPIYLMGIYFARYDIKPNLWIGLAGMAAYYVYRSLGGDITRFPPSLGWIAGSFFFALTGYVLARFLSRWTPARRALVRLGVNALFCILTSNILLFAFRGAAPRLAGEMNLRSTLGVTVAILAILYFMVQSVRRIDADPAPAITPSKSA
ncbi:MAG: hypothetical protein AB1750_07095 [Chloroflexota bacterium]